MVEIIVRGLAVYLVLSPSKFFFLFFFFLYILKGTNYCTDYLKVMLVLVCNSMAV